MDCRARFDAPGGTYEDVLDTVTSDSGDDLFNLFGNILRFKRFGQAAGPADPEYAFSAFHKHQLTAAGTWDNHSHSGSV
jgi:hypothetical protein